MSVFKRKPDAHTVSFFDGLKGLEYKEGLYSKDTEGYNLNGRFEPGNNRLSYFLSCAEIAVFPFIDKEGKVDIYSLAKSCGYKINEIDDIYGELEKLSKKKKYKKDFENGMPKEEIDGFSIKHKKEIFINKNACKEKRVFAAVHELSHGLLDHNREIFCKISDCKESKKFEGEAYNEEADRLGAIILMPHFLIINKLERSDSSLACKFGVLETAIKKRKEEVIKEADELGYIPTLKEEDIV